VLGGSISNLCAMSRWYRGLSSNTAPKIGFEQVLIRARHRSARGNPETVYDQSVWATGRSIRVWRCWDPPGHPALLPAGL